MYVNPVELPRKQYRDGNSTSNSFCETVNSIYHSLSLCYQAIFFQFNMHTQRNYAKSFISIINTPTSYELLLDISFIYRLWFFFRRVCVCVNVCMLSKHVCTN